jgi:hypothetical protein
MALLMYAVLALADTVPSVAAEATASFILCESSIDILSNFGVAKVFISRFYEGEGFTLHLRFVFTRSEKDA